VAKGASQGGVNSMGVRAPPLLSLFGDEPVLPARARQMSRIRGRDTRPELALRKALWRAGVRFRVDVRGLPGRPDVANRRAKFAVFVDGCFWHGCPWHFKAPKTRRAFWSEKIERNKRKRIEVLRSFPQGWLVVELFECELEGPRPPEIAKELVRR
jgi:DNA mismatch endonuclease, patch repair protein